MAKGTMRIELRSDPECDEYARVRGNTITMGRPALGLAHDQVLALATHELKHLLVGETDGRVREALDQLRKIPKESVPGLGFQPIVIDLVSEWGLPTPAERDKLWRLHFNPKEEKQ